MTDAVIVRAQGATVPILLVEYIVIIYKVGWLCGRGSSVVMRTTVLSVASRARTRTTASVIVTVTSALGIAF